MQHVLTFQSLDFVYIHNRIVNSIKIHTCNNYISIYCHSHTTIIPFTTTDLLTVHTSNLLVLHNAE